MTNQDTTLTNQDALPSDEQIADAFKNTNFGSTDFRAILLEGLRSAALGYHNGWTLTQILRRLNLSEPKDIDSNKLNKNGLIFIEQAATQASESEINSLKQRVEELEQENEGLKVQSNRLANGFVSIVEMDNVDFRVKAIAISLTTAYDFNCLAQHDNEVIDRCKNIVANDALAITFQSMGAYRSAIIKAINAMKVNND